MKNKTSKTIIFFCIIFSCIFIGGGCSSNQNEKRDITERKPFSGVKIRLAKQYGMQYAAVYVVEKMNLLEKYLPGAEAEWSSFGGGAAITEALIGGHLDVGFMGIPPAVVAIDKGADLKIALGVSVPPNALIVKEERLKSIADFTPNDKIAVPGIASIQHILLSIAAKNQLNKARDFDVNMITMANPDAYSALISGGDIAGHFTTMPYIEMEKRAGLRNILTGKEAYGDVSIICVTTGKFHSNHAVYSGLMGALSEAMDLINRQTPEVLDIISQVEKLPVDDVKAFLNWDGTNYTANIYGLTGLVEYMHDAGYIKKTLSSEDLLWENARAMIGKRAGEISPVEKILNK